MLVSSDNRKRIGFIAFLSAMALVFSVLMAVESVRGVGMVGCGAGSGCDSVLSTRWSSLFGFIPVSSLAAGLYLAMLLCCAVLLKGEDEELLLVVQKAMLVMCGAIFGSALWFIALQQFEVHAFCKYCMSVHAAGLAVSALVLKFVHLVRNGSDDAGYSVSKPLMFKLFAAGLILAGCLALLQVSIKADPIYQRGESLELLPSVNPDEFPVIGDPSSDAVIEILFDYQCSHCRSTHALLEKIAAENEGRVAFVLCPSPLSPACNPYIPHDANESFLGSCELAEYALAVWRTDRSLFWKYDAWLFGLDEDSWSPRRITDARLKAEEMLGGADVLKNAMENDGWIPLAIARTTEIFGRTTSSGKSGIPRLIYGQKWLVPQVDTESELLDLLSSEFGLQL